VFSDDEDETKKESTGARSMIHISKEDSDELIKYRNFFGAPNFFKIFRAFYKLANIPEDA